MRRMERRRGERRRLGDDLLGRGGSRVGPSGPVTPQPTSPVDAVLGGGEAETSPWVNPFMEVYETTKAGAMQNLEEMQKGMAERFAHRGGYFGGKHAIGQAEMATKTGTALDELLAKTSLGASEREYQDWLRARGEQFAPLDMLGMLLGQDTFENIVQQPGQGKGGGAGSTLGSLAGSFLGPLGAAAGGAAGEAIF